MAAHIVGWGDGSRVGPKGQLCALFSDVLDAAIFARNQTFASNTFNSGPHVRHLT